MKLTYVCTNYNNSKYTVAAVASLARNVGHEVRIYVVDNASRPNEVQQLRALASTNSTVRIIVNKVNIGYFAGLNVGIAAARRDDAHATWMVVGNNDLEFPKEFCDCLERRQAEYSLHSVVSPDVVTLDGEHQNPHVIDNISSMRELFYDLYYSNYWLGQLVYRAAKMFPKVTRRGDEDHWRVARSIYQGHGSVYVLTPKFFGQFESLWAPTFMMSEEFFLSHQLKVVGERVWYSPAIKVIHHWHGSLQTLPNRSRWNMARAAHREYRKHVKALGGNGR